MGIAMEEKKETAVQQTETGQVVTKKTSVTPENQGTFQLNYIVYYLLGVLEVLLAFRLVFKLLGANPNSGFVSFIYSLSRVFVTPFSGIFSTATTTGVETVSVLEPATIIAMVVYALVAWGIAKLISVTMAGKTA